MIAGKVTYVPQRPVVGVLALQGDVREHAALLERAGARALAVRRVSELAEVDGLVLPGGESTTMSRLLDSFALLEPLRHRIRDGLPVFGSCAGMVLLARQVLDGRPDQRQLDALDVVVRRNAFGRQVDSFETELEVAGVEGRVQAVFIRAPWVEKVGHDVQVLATVVDDPLADPAADRIVAVRQGRVFATAFHPELTGDERIHRLFVRTVSEVA
ncbi:pyridoxal 5'-phosphate synthase glutaminase subunit PdxT [Saccharomonospora azurea]|uniref:Pyridoxal 5'-phosphate synthase subunit PdxT n=1 Tax=Saccharomonospora azurea NA-128 TaxID=882081 RepID=H8G6W1_9PSEU|nr:pyridoxal 5'-phosphate synthase glutaminase subunit PdxT [Saccharomonospora azurea]EHK81146.1 glutamine amidotransferase subunit PdxT [Saccharomonospora azurea SZMC 14600]EHY91344.1 pyridoxal 5''-phosphate synthase, glutaminase subunit Pdx2 [Saccharomonospora azurea NA-128]